MVDALDVFLSDGHIQTLGECLVGLVVWGVDDGVAMLPLIPGCFPELKYQGGDPSLGTEVMVV